MTDIILHAGFHKTGSSSIQSAFATHQMDGCGYLDWQRANHSMPFMDAFTNGELAVMKPGQAGPDTDKSRKLIANLNHALGNLRVPRTIISGESFSIAGYRPGLERFAEVLRAHATGIRVIAYVRPVASLFASDFQQCARAGLKTEIGRSPSYLQRMTMLDEVFGRENVDFRIYDRARLVEGDVVTDFAHQIGVDPPDLDQPRANTAFSLEAVAVARCSILFGKIGFEPVDLGLNYFTSNQLRGIGSTRFQIDHQEVARMVAPFEAEMKLVENRIGDRFPAPAHRSGGIRGDEDLLLIAGDCEEKVQQVLTSMASRHPDAPKIIERTIADARDLGEAHYRVATLIDGMKRVRLRELGQPVDDASTCAA